MEIDSYWLMCQCEQGTQREKIARNYKKHLNKLRVIELMIQACKCMGWKKEFKAYFTKQEWVVVQ
jgi:hypothetical protein